MANIVGFMQGRLCDQVDNKIQAFPWKEWEGEFADASRININLMEWTLDQEAIYENPLMTHDGQRRIRDLVEEFNVDIPSLTGDCFMQAPFWKAQKSSAEKLKNDFLAICEASSIVGVKMIVVPLVDNGRLDICEQENLLLEFLLSNQSFFTEKNLKIAFESDFSPSELKRFIGQLPKELFGINYDTGNSAALGYHLADEFAAYGDRIVNVHVKDRVLGGATVPLLSGSVDFPSVFSHLNNINYCGNFILQTARDKRGHHSEVISKYRDLVMAWYRAESFGANIEEL